MKHLQLTSWVAIITWSSHFQKFYQRPHHDHSSVLCFQPNGYSLFVASLTYVSGETRDCAVYMVYEISWCLEARNDLCKYTKVHRQLAILKVSYHVMSPVYFDAGVHTYTVFIAKYQATMVDTLD